MRLLLRARKLGLNPGMVAEEAMRHFGLSQQCVSRPRRGGGAYMTYLCACVCACLRRELEDLLVRFKGSRKGGKVAFPQFCELMKIPE